LIFIVVTQLFVCQYDNAQPRTHACFPGKQAVAMVSND